MKRPQSYVRVAIASLAVALSLPSFAASDITCSPQIDINKADAVQLSTCVKGIGPKAAKAIVDYRTTNGNFKSVKDIAVVKGIGENRAAKLAPQLTVGGNDQLKKATNR